MKNSLDPLKEGLENTRTMRQEVASTKASFSKDNKTVSAKIEELKRGGRAESSWEVADGLDSMKTVVYPAFPKSSSPSTVDVLIVETGAHQATRPTNQNRYCHSKGYGCLR